MKNNLLCFDRFYIFSTCNSFTHESMAQCSNILLNISFHSLRLKKEVTFKYFAMWMFSFPSKGTSFFNTSLITNAFKQIMMGCQQIKDVSNE